MFPVKKLVLLLFCCCMVVVSLAQSGQDTIPPRPQRDTAAPVKKETKEPAETKEREPKEPVKEHREHREAKDTVVRGTPVPDSGRIKADTARLVADSNRVARPAVVQGRPDSTLPAASIYKGPPMPVARPTLMGYQRTLQQHPYYNFYGKAVVITEHLKKSSNDEGLFYFLAALLFYFGFIRIAFMKYLDNLNTLFFRVTMRQQQIRDQVLQSPLPSLFLNILFFISGGLFLSFLVDYYNMLPGMNRWLVLLYCCALLTAIYLGKFILLKMVGWMFNIRVAVDTYIFIVFLVNKMLGIYLLPVLLLMAFSKGTFLTVLITLTYAFLVILFIYRFIIAYRPIRNEIRLSRFLFFLYLCAFEIAPLLLIYKVLLIFVERSY
jgi:hypothetical protein